MKPFTVATWISLSAGLLFAAVCGQAALENNNQGEFRDPLTGAIHWAPFAPVIAGNFVCMAALVFGVLCLGLVAFRGIRRLARAIKAQR